VGADHQVGIDRGRSVRCRCDEAAYSPVRLLELGDLGLHRKTKRRVRSRLRCDEIEEVPLRHQRDELAASGQMREITERQHLASDTPRDLANLPVRATKELVENTQLIQDFERGGMDRVPTEIAQKV